MEIPPYALYLININFSVRNFMFCRRTCEILFSAVLSGNMYSYFKDLEAIDWCPFKHMRYFL
jgi:hypothetical protein